MTDRLPPLNALRAFEAAGRRLSFSKAAADLGVTPGAVSRQIKLLEDHLLVQLFERGHREVKLTGAGVAYLESLSDAFATIEAATRRLVGSYRERPLHVFASMMFTMRWLMPRLGAAGGTLAQEIRLTTSLTAEPNPFGAGDVDAAVYLGREDWPGMVCHHLLASRLIPVCSPALLQGRALGGVEDLHHHTLLHSLVFPDNWAKYLTAAGHPALQGAANIGLGSSSLAYQAAIEGIGVALAQVSQIREDLVAGRLVTPLPFTLEDGSFYILAYPPNAVRNRMLATFVHWLREQASLDSLRAQAGQDLDAGRRLGNAVTQ